MSIELKIKSKHLSAEAKIIRFEERKILQNKKIDEERKTSIYNSLMTHRIRDVRNENRATFLARAFLKNIPYNKLEQKRNDEILFVKVILPRIMTMVLKYGLHDSSYKTYNYKTKKYEPTDKFKEELLTWANVKK